MAASQPALFNIQEFTDNGITLVGGRLYTYAFGTTTLKVAYANPEGTVPQTYTADGLGGQYIALNARGELATPLYLASNGAYDISLKRADGSTVWTRRTDGVGNFEFAIRAPTGSAQIGNGGESVAESFNALQLPDYTALQNYVGPRRCVYITGYMALAAQPAIAGMFVADASDTTSTTNGGTLFVATNGVRWKRQYTGGVDVRWWGAKFDNTTDDTAAIQACVNYAQPLQKQIILPEGTAKITASIRAAFSLLGLNMLGQGFQRTRLNYAGITPAVNPAIIITGHSGQGCGAVIEGIRFDGNATSSGILIAGQDLQTIRNCQFGLNANGIVFRNAVAGSFTEYCVADACDFLPECASAIWYSIEGTGDMSFHGSGLRNCTIASPSTPGYRCIVVDPKALPYNSPLSAQFWGNGVGDIISMPGYSGSNIPIFVGNLTVEAFVPGLVGCKAPIGYEVPLVGKLSCASPNFSMGSLFLADAAIGSSGGTLQTIGGRVEHYQNLVPGANAMGRIPPSMAKGAVEYLVHIIGPLYDYRYKVGTFTTLSGGTAQILATYAQYNQAGYGAPTFSIDPTVGSLVITNAAFPSSGVSVTVSAIQVGQSVYDPFFL